MRNGFAAASVFVATASLSAALPLSETSLTEPACLTTILTSHSLQGLCADNGNMQETLEATCPTTEVEVAQIYLDQLCLDIENVQPTKIISRDLLSGQLSDTLSDPLDISSQLDNGAVSALNPTKLIQGVASAVKTAPAALKSLESVVESAPVVDNVASAVNPASLLQDVQSVVTAAPKALASVVSAAADVVPKPLGSVVSAVADVPKEILTPHPHVLSAVSHPTASLASSTFSFGTGQHAVPTSALRPSGAAFATGTRAFATGAWPVATGTRPLATAVGTITALGHNATATRLVTATGTPTLFRTPPAVSLVTVHDGDRVTVTAPMATVTAGAALHRAPAAGAAAALAAGIVMLL